MKKFHNLRSNIINDIKNSKNNNNDDEDEDIIEEIDSKTESADIQNKLA